MNREFAVEIYTLRGRNATKGTLLHWTRKSRFPSVRRNFLLEMLRIDTDYGYPERHGGSHR